jgi:phospholipase A1
VAAGVARGFALLLLLCVAPAGLQAADCSVIQDPGARLACYDAHASATGGPDATEATEERALEPRLRSARRLEHEPFAMRPYRPNYLLPIAYSEQIGELSLPSDPQTGLDSVEVKFQLSLQFHLADNLLGSGGDLYAAYSQVSFWQAYNGEASRPFRETNHEPEIGMSWLTDFRVLGFTNRVLRVGLVHQSNGRSEPLSRSWNRVFGLFGLERGRFAVLVRPWWRIPETDGQDDNPDIDEYLGYGEVYLLYRWGRQTLGVMARNNLDTDENRGALQVDWSYPLTPKLKAYAQYFNGYGESLIDYDRRVTRVGLGIMLTDWI